MKKKISLICFATTFIFTLIFAQTSKISWQPLPLQIDGNPNDWITNLRFYDADSKIKYEFRNDANHLYFSFKSDERSLQFQLQQVGMKMKFIVKSKPKIVANITFPTKNNGGGRSSMREMQNSTLPQKDELKLNTFAMRAELAPKDTAIIKGFVFAKDFVVGSTDQNNGINFAKSQGNSEETAFELVIPLRELFGDGYNLNEIILTPIQFQLNIAVPSQISNNGNMGRPRGGMGAPGGGMEGGMGGDRTGGDPGNGMNGGGEMGERPQTSHANVTGMPLMTAKNIKFEFILTTEQ